MTQAPSAISHQLITLVRKQDDTCAKTIGPKVTNDNKLFELISLFKFSWLPASNGEKARPEQNWWSIVASKRQVFKACTSKVHKTQSITKWQHALFPVFANRATPSKLHAWIHARTASNWHRVWNTQLELFDNIWIIDDELTLVMWGTQKNLKIECQLSTVPNVNCFSPSAHPTKSKWCFSSRDYYTLQRRIKFQKQYQGDQYHFNYKSQSPNSMKNLKALAWHD